MKAAAKELEFERAAAIRDEIQQVRLRVLEQDASVVVARARRVERAAKDALLPAKERAARTVRAARAGAHDHASSFEVTEVRVLQARRGAGRRGRRADRHGQRAVPGHPRRARR